MKTWFQKCIRWYCRFWHSETWRLLLSLGTNSVSLSSECPKCGRVWPRDMMTIREGIRVSKWATERNLNAKDLLALLPPKKDREKIIRLGLNKGVE